MRHENLDLLLHVPWRQRIKEMKFFNSSRVRMATSLYSLTTDLFIILFILFRLGFWSYSNEARVFLPDKIKFDFIINVRHTFVSLRLLLIEGGSSNRTEERTSLYGFAICIQRLNIYQRLL